MREKSEYYIHPSGGLLSIQFIEKLKQKDAKEKYSQANTFSIKGEKPPSPSDLEKKITEAWNNLLERWFSVSIYIKDFDVSTARKRWIIPFLEALDYEPEYLKKDTLVSEEKDFKVAISHKGGDWDYAPMINTVEPSQDLDERITKGRGVKSPHDSLQIYLNESDDDLWGMVTNGIVLRVLRKYYHTYTKGYIEFDLEGMFVERSYSDFLALYKLVHPSRFIPDVDGIPPLEHFFNISRAAGEKIGEYLRENVKAAIEVLGNGFLTNEMVDRMIEDQEVCKEYYQEILHIIYRIMFLMYAEQRGMLPPRDSLYTNAYSLTRLRERAEKAKRKDRHYDIWKGLLVTFNIVSKGSDDPKMGVFGYNGSLFDEKRIARLIDLNCENTHILEAIRYLTYFESEKTLQRISYVDLGVEEIGSIYESLLDYVPRVSDVDVIVNGNTYLARNFFLDSRGATRKSTGSYYTDPNLIDELIQHSLKTVLDKKLEGINKKYDKEKALLSLKLCDPACGSAAFLIAATNFLGRELAKIRTGTEYPPEDEERRARREVLQHCIYGVDINPMAVDLAKVSLWINACLKDLPLNFLDHHIKCGDSIVGTTPELIKNGILTEAYTSKRLSKEKAKLINKIKKLNKEELKGQRRIDDESWEKRERKEKILKEFQALNMLTEKDAMEVENKKEEYEEIIKSEEYQKEKLSANAWVAPFFWPIEIIDNETKAFTHADFQNLRDNSDGYVTPNKLSIISDLSDKKKFFHWFIEFPEIFNKDENGFDCIIGNPPFLGGLKISTTFGINYRNYLEVMYKPFIGTSDLCAAFYRQVFYLLKKGGQIGMVATNTIGQGDTRETSLAILIKNGAIINYVRRFVKWPGEANVEVNLLALKCGTYDGRRILDDNDVEYISSRLDDLPEIDPVSLKQNDGYAFIGDYVRGIGFIIDSDEGERIIKSNKNNSTVLIPYLIGVDINNNPKQNPSRYVICFQDWSLEKAEEYPELLEIVIDRVKPFRDQVNDKHEKEKWWLFARYRNELRKSIENLSRILVRSRVSELHMLVFEPNEYSFSDATVVFAFDDFYHFSILQSNIHELWVRKYSSSLESRNRYTPEDCFDNFPFPQDVSDDDISRVEKVGKVYYELRQDYLAKNQIGLTKLYNKFHNSDCQEQEIKKLRELHAELDKTVLTCYNWEEITLNHDFHQNERGQIRYHISDEARRELLKRLIERNKEIALKEIEEEKI